ncbi:hypothetical protein DPMN_146262 [Dreissena polymorpha]|uniref:Uncharacterized protein n=1 Tax=Dreissena polymorpha TaxID=45954 RepID=A0A9D4F8A7_DREPO|nr:hypothetical protein DPMN_146262 [Dreissena polymorpha]
MLHKSFKNSLEDECKQCETFISKIKVHAFKSFTSPEKYFILNRKCLDQTASAELFLRNVTTNADIEFQHNKDLEIVSLLSKISGISPVAL